VPPASRAQPIDWSRNYALSVEDTASLVPVLGDHALLQVVSLFWAMAAAPDFRHSQPAPPLRGAARRHPAKPSSLSYCGSGHQRLASASLIRRPHGAVTIAGMLPFKPVFPGAVSEAAPRATTGQKCIPAPNDIENVGRTGAASHIFEMLGNFRLATTSRLRRWPGLKLSTELFRLDSAARLGGERDP